jgi:hypothetical protein
LVFLKDQALMDQPNAPRLASLVSKFETSGGTKPEARGAWQPTRTKSLTDTKASFANSAQLQKERRRIAMTSSGADLTYHSLATTAVEASPDPGLPKTGLTPTRQAKGRLGKRNTKTDETDD